MRPLITIAMPIYNVEKYIKEAMVSVLSQTYNNIEFLIIDDRGSDKSMMIVNDIIDNYNGNKTIRIIKHDENKGLSEARNTAMNEAKGEYIYFIDSDDFITKDCIEKMYNIIKDNNNVDFVVASYKKIFETKTINDDSITLENISIKNSTKIKEYIFQNPSKRFIGYVWNKLFKISFLKRNGLSFIPKIYYEDDIFSLKAYMGSDSLTCLADITYYYRQREDSIMYIGKGAFIKKEIQDYSYTRKQEKNFLKEFSDIKYYKNEMLYIAGFCFFNAKAYINHNDNKVNIKPYIKDILYYPLSLNKILFARKDFIKHFFFWSLSKFPYFITRLILKSI